MIVPSRPLMRPAILQQACRGGFDHGLRGMEFYPLGRHALLAALLRVGVRPGDTIVFPAFYCESTLSVLRGHGFDLRYVDVRKDLRLNERDLLALCERKTVRAVVIVHYFGFRASISPDLEKVCKRHGIHVIEDYCHSFLSFDFLERKNTSGLTSAFVFSMRKILPVPDGGALLMRATEDEERGKDVGARKRAGILEHLLFLARGAMEALCIRLGWPNLYSRRMDRLKEMAGRYRGGPSRPARAAAGAPPSIEPSFFLHRLLGNHDMLREIAKQRRRNYCQLHAELRGISGLGFLATEVTDCVPFVLPVLTSNAGRLLARLRRSGIGAFCWPGEEMPLEVRERPELFPNAIETNSRVVCMAIHQDISEAHIQHMVEVARDFFQQEPCSGKRT